MKQSGRKWLLQGLALLSAFLLLTLLVSTVDLQPAGPRESVIGLAGINLSFHRLTGVHLDLYVLTDWLGLVPVFVGMGFAVLGLCQWIKRKSIRKVDGDILLLGGYYLALLGCYLFFEAHPVNFRPVLLEGRLEASYPSSTVLLTCTVMASLIFQAKRRLKQGTPRKAVAAAAGIFALLMTAGRLVAGVHWITDIAAALLLSGGLFRLYQGAAALLGPKEQ